jgi:hypothetical protein
MIQSVSDVTLSIHRAWNIEIAYRISDSLQPPVWEQEIKNYEMRTKQAIRDRKATFTGGGADANFQVLAEVIARARSDYTRFLTWANENAENAPR